MLEYLKYNAYLECVNGYQIITVPKRDHSVAKLIFAPRSDGKIDSITICGIASLPPRKEIFGFPIRWMRESSDLVFRLISSFFIEPNEIVKPDVLEFLKTEAKLFSTEFVYCQLGDYDRPYHY